MRVSPSPEAAARFAAAGETEAATALERHVRAAHGTGRTGLATFADECGTPGVERAVVLVEAAAGAPPEERERSLDRAQAAVLDGAREAAADAAAELRGPATAVYAFGVLLPLALVAVLPAAEVAGVVASVPLVVGVYDLALPAVLALAGHRLLDRRPTAFPPPVVDRDHPAVPDYPWRALAAGVGGGGGSGVLAGLVLPSWSVPLVAVGTGIGAVLAVGAAPYARVHGCVDERERDLPDACSLVGAAVADGTAVERALADAASDLGGPTGEVLGEAVARQRQLGVTVEAAFVDAEGPLTSTPSARFRDVARLFGVAAREGRPAGQALVAFGDHLAELRAVEREARRDLRRVTATLSNTAAVFAPLVGGATVAMAGAMGDGLPVATLGLAVGVYVLVLAALLAALASGLERGPSPGLVARRAGGALLTATPTYLLAFVAAGALA
jgi:hypothetical protein